MWVWILVNFVGFLFTTIVKNPPSYFSPLFTLYPETNVIYTLNCCCILVLFCFALFRLLVKYIENSVLVCSTFVVGCNYFVIIIFWFPCVRVCVCWGGVCGEWHSQNDLWKENYWLIDSFDWMTLVLCIVFFPNCFFFFFP